MEVEVDADFTIIPCVPKCDSRRRSGVMAEESTNMDGRRRRRRSLATLLDCLLIRMFLAPPGRMATIVEVVVAVAVGEDDEIP